MLQGNAGWVEVYQYFTRFQFFRPRSCDQIIAQHHVPLPQYVPQMCGTGILIVVDTEITFSCDDYLTDAEEVGVLEACVRGVCVKARVR